MAYEEHSISSGVRKDGNLPESLLNSRNKPLAQMLASQHVRDSPVFCVSGCCFAFQLTPNMRVYAVRTLHLPFKMGK